LLQAKANSYLFILGLMIALFNLAAAQESRDDAWAVLIGQDFVRYVPGIEEWNLYFWVVGDGWKSSPAKLTNIKVVADGVTLPLDTVEFKEAPWVKANGRLTEAQVREIRQAALSEAIAPQDIQRLEALTKQLTAILEEVPAATLTIKRALPEGQHLVEVYLSYEKDGLMVNLVENTEVVISAIPKASGWFSADPHIHSTYSDSNASHGTIKSELTKRGYYIGYLTDHTNKLISSNNFPNMNGAYPKACKNVSTSTTSLFPGIEMRIGHKILGVWNGDGHCLGYGVTSTTNLDDNTYGAQVGLRNINGNNSPKSSSAIAHPTHDVYKWEDWTVTYYYGIELMSGPQLAFDYNASPVKKWRSECARLAAWNSFRPSVRTGSDAHSISGFKSYVTHVKLASDTTWNNGTWEQRRSAVDTALKNGKTTISRKGSLAYFTANGYDVGSAFIPPSGSVSFYIYFKPVVSGTYNLYLFRDNLAGTVWSKLTQSLTANSAYGWTTTYPLPSGRHYYWLYVVGGGGEWCYTTPIYITKPSS